jgi:hypothetical protein
MRKGRVQMRDGVDKDADDTAVDLKLAGDTAE